MKTRPNPAVLLISSEFPPNVGGIGNHAFNVAKYLSLNGFTVEVIADLIEVDETTLKEFECTIPFKLHAVPRRKFVVMSYLQRVQAAISLGRKAGVIICSGKFPLWQVLVLKRFLPRKKFIAVVHGSELDIRQAWAKNLTDKSLEKFDAVISVSHFTAEYLPANVKAKNITTVIHNGINNDEFKTEAVPNLKGDPSIITVGSVTDRKGQANVINALPQLLKLYPRLHYHIVGKPVIKDRLTALAMKLGVMESITFHGIVKRKELPGLIAGSTVKMMLSNHTEEGDFEGFGIGIIEANAMGRPAIGARLGGIPDAIHHGVTGRLADPKDTTEIASSLNHILHSYNDYSNNALRWAKAHDWSILIRQYITVIHKTCNV